jgi:hypothetical protein
MFWTMLGGGTMEDDNPAKQIALYRRIIAQRLVPAEVQAVAAQLLAELESKAGGPSVQVPFASPSRSLLNTVPRRS